MHCANRGRRRLTTATCTERRPSTRAARVWRAAPPAAACAARGRASPRRLPAPSRPLMVPPGAAAGPARASCAAEAMARSNLREAVVRGPGLVLASQCTDQASDVHKEGEVGRQRRHKMGLAAVALARLGLHPRLQQPFGTLNACRAFVDCLAARSCPSATGKVEAPRVGASPAGLWGTRVAAMAGLQLGSFANLAPGVLGQRAGGERRRPRRRPRYQARMPVAIGPGINRAAACGKELVLQDREQTTIMHAR